VEMSSFHEKVSDPEEGRRSLHLLWRSQSQVVAPTATSRLYKRPRNRFKFVRHPEVFDVSREAIPTDDMALQSVFENVGVSEVHPRHEVQYQQRLSGDGVI